MNNEGDQQEAMMRLQSGMLPEQILDLLTIEGPMATGSIANRLGAKKDSAYRALTRLKSKGLVSSRAVERYVGSSVITTMEWFLP